MQNHGILVDMECADGQPVKAGLEALNAAQRLAAQQGGNCSRRSAVPAEHPHAEGFHTTGAPWSMFHAHQ